MNPLFNLLIAFSLSVTSSVIAQNKPLQEAKSSQSHIDVMTAEGHVKTSVTGYHMKAKINGKEWIATRMVPDNDQSNILLVQAFIGTSAVANAIVFKVSWKSESEGKKRSITGDSDIYYYDDDMNGYKAISGERETTKMDDNWIEGKFHFSAVDDKTGKKMEVTEGFYRVPNPSRFSK